jgi:hypothetical protein
MALLSFSSDGHRRILIAYPAFAQSFHQGAVALADDRIGIERIEQRPRFLSRRTGVLLFDDMPGWIDVENIAGHQPVEQHAQRRQMLLDGRSRDLAPQPF